MLHVACFIAKSVRFMTALDVGGNGCVRGRTPAVLGRGAGGRWRCGETMRGPGTLSKGDADACGGLGDACGDFEEGACAGW